MWTLEQRVVHNGRPSHSIVVLSLLTVYELSTQLVHKLGRAPPIFFEHFEIPAKTWHTLFHLSRTFHAQSRVHPSLAHQIACHSVNHLSWYNKATDLQVKCKPRNRTTDRQTTIVVFKF